jgi:hypothetical protein
MSDREMDENYEWNFTISVHRYKCFAHLHKTFEISAPLTGSGVVIILLSVRSTQLLSRSIGWHKFFEIESSDSNTIMIVHLSDLIAAPSGYTSCYVTTTSCLTLPTQYEVLIAKLSDQCCEHRKNHGVVFICGLHLTAKLYSYSAACSLSDVESHFFQN